MMVVILSLLMFVHFADRPDLNDWAASLKSKQGMPCCSFVDAETLSDVQWDTKDGHYRVFLDGNWLDVPDEAVITVPNKYGEAVVWPLRYGGKGVGKAYGVRCFIPGAGS